MDRLEDIKNHPESHKHTFDELFRCCWNDNGPFCNTDLLEAHKIADDNGVKHDVIKGTCCCGAVHVC